MTNDVSSVTADAAVGSVASGGGGLTSAEAQARLEYWGPNQLPEADTISWWVRVGRQLQSPIIYIRLFALAFGLVIWVLTAPLKMQDRRRNLFPRRPTIRVAPSNPRSPSTIPAPHAPRAGEQEAAHEY